MALPKGFAGSFDDQVSSSLDLNQLLIQSPPSTYFMRVQGDGQVLEGAEDGDIVVVNRALTAINGDLVIVVIDGELSLKHFTGGALTTRDGTESIMISTGDDVEFWGVVTASIKQYR